MTDPINKILELSFSDNNDRQICQTLSVPSDIFQEYDQFIKSENKFSKLVEPSDMLGMLFENGAFLCGKNASVIINKDQSILETDYNEKGIEIERRHYNPSKELYYRELDLKEYGHNFPKKDTFFSTWHMLQQDSNAIKITFRSVDYLASASRPAGRYGLIDTMVLSFQNGLKVQKINDAEVAGQPETTEMNRDIKAILETSSDIAERHQLLAKIILPVHETIELIKKSMTPVLI